MGKKADECRLTEQFEGMKHFRSMGDDEPKEKPKTKAQLEQESAENFEGPRRGEW